MLRSGLFALGSAELQALTLDVDISANLPGLFPSKKRYRTALPLKDPLISKLPNKV